MSSLINDLRYAFRFLRKKPGFAAIAVATLALGIGANTAMFSVVHAVLLQPHPYPAEDPDRVLILAEKSAGLGRISVAYPDFKDWQRMNHSFSEMAAYRSYSYNMTGLEEPLRVQAYLTTFNYFNILGVAPGLGRFYTAEEDKPGSAGMVVLNHPFWQNRFGADPAAIGKILKLHDQIYTVIGVLPPDFELTSRERIYVPLEPWADNVTTQNRGNHTVR